jgi:hypothetical protein
MKLSTPPTSVEQNEDESLLREGLLLKVTLDDGTTGFGEVRYNFFIILVPVSMLDLMGLKYL